MKRNVLLVDDDDVFNMLNSKILEKTGFHGNIYSVSNGLEAIHFLENLISAKQPLPDLILLDINMPIMDGFQFVDEIKAHPSIDHLLMKIIILSSSIDYRDRERAIKLGINGYVEKPLTIPLAKSLFQDNK
ncbi:CheY chemotaxis protein or a CheY-like REC (receiver) domain [Chryseolinea serpens]|uniref:CheY chemotaxis protein or a CheY-like REC (Receiver) domain n=1 Tax=Chryseolinea serpens TaxID=947013 RepID=A0A1M5MN65_9BACT|nr:response regulator [Chryseolinea serpens]SHG78711.1 CheY chemotaxis protein or a CheY-like REC (receiver) domain [Chryseolinea serpens]